MNGRVLEVEHLTDFITQFWLLTSRRGRRMRSPLWRLEIADNRHRAELPENSTDIILSGQNGMIINGWAAFSH